MRESIIHAIRTFFQPFVWLFKHTETTMERPAVWCLDATCIAEFPSIDAALREWNEIDDGLFVKIGENEFWVNKDDISVMDEEEFNSL